MLTVCKIYNESSQVSAGREEDGIEVEANSAKASDIFILPASLTRRRSDPSLADSFDRCFLAIDISLMHKIH